MSLLPLVPISWGAQLSMSFGPRILPTQRENRLFDIANSTGNTDIAAAVIDYDANTQPVSLTSHLINGLMQPYNNTSSRELVIIQFQPLIVSRQRTVSTWSHY